MTVILGETKLLVRVGRRPNPCRLSSLSRRDGAIVAWHEVPEKAGPRKSRPVGYV
jgi:hypothetical protein